MSVHGGPANWWTDGTSDGNIYFVKIYNRALSDDEITNEYLAYRGRLGI